MNTIHFSENIIRLRRQRKITQEELAGFIGVTKASVSKWENGQSMPDVQLLPQLAAFFDVSIDALIGYDPQLSQEQIQKLYLEFTSDFSRLPFDKALEKVRAAVHRYYSCYPFLLQVCILYLNHYMLIPEEAMQKEFLAETMELCDRILKNCKLVGVCNDAMSLKAMLQLLLGNPGEVIASLEEITDPRHASTGNSMLMIQAYQMTGELEKAQNFTQITIYSQLLSLVGASVQYLAMNMDHPAVCEETVRRIESLESTWKLDELNPNLMAQFHCQAAMAAMAQSQPALAIRHLGRYSQAIRTLLLKDHCMLHGDAYFDRLDHWIDQLDLGANPPRDISLVTGSALQLLEHPLFSALADDPEFQKIKCSVTELQRI